MDGNSLVKIDGWMVGKQSGKDGWMYSNHTGRDVWMDGYMDK